MTLTMTMARCPSRRAALSGPPGPASKQGKVSVMYCIQELLSDHYADVIVGFVVLLEFRTLEVLCRTRFKFFSCFISFAFVLFHQKGVSLGGVFVRKLAGQIFLEAFREKYGRSWRGEQDMRLVRSVDYEPRHHGSAMCFPLGGSSDHVIRLSQMPMIYALRSCACQSPVHVWHLSLSHAAIAQPSPLPPASPSLSPMQCTVCHLFSVGHIFIISFLGEGVCKNKRKKTLSCLPL